MLRSNFERADSNIDSFFNVKRAKLAREKAVAEQAARQKEIEERRRQKMLREQQEREKIERIRLRREREQMESQRKEAELAHRPLVERAFRKALEGKRTRPEDFVGAPGFSEEKISWDLQHVKDEEASYKKRDSQDRAEDRMWAVVLEQILHEQLELGDWLGPSALTYETSRSDDIKNHMDSLLEFTVEGQEEPLRLGLDFTLSNDPSYKFQPLKDQMDRGELGYLGYYQNKDGSGKRSLRNLPRVIICVDRATVKELAKIWIDMDKPELRRAKLEELKNHPIQLEIADQVELELRTFTPYAKRKDKTELVDIYEPLLETIRAVQELPEKKELAAKQPERAWDPNVEKIRKALLMF